MAVPIDPTSTSIVTQALKRAGRTTPSAAQIQEALDHQLQEVKADIMLAAPTHQNLMSTSTTVTTRGQQRYAIPSDANELSSISLMDGPDEWRGTSQGGSTTTIQFAATLQVEADAVVGKYVLLTGGSGIEEYRQVLTYDTSTQTAGIDLPWTSNPTAATNYLIVDSYTQLWPSAVQADFDRIENPTSIGTPRVAAVFSQEYLLYPVPDKSTYGLMQRGWVDLSLLNETDVLFIQLLREWRSLWIQGVAVKSMQRFDEDRYQSELQVYKLMLDLLTSQTCQVRQVRPFDVA